MDLSSGSSSSSRSRSTGQKICHCGIPAKLFTSSTEKNPGRRFFGCSLYEDGGSSHCKYFRWFDEVEVKGWPKRALFEALTEIREKNKVIDQLSITIMELRSELEKHQLEISSLDTEDEEKHSTENEWKTKIANMEKVVDRQRFILTGLTGLLVCAIGVIIFG